MEEEEESIPPSSSTIKMNFQFHYFFFFFFLVSGFPFSSADDAAVMIKLSQSFTPPPPGWVGPNACKWQGVSCDSSGKVVSITLVAKSLVGKFPPDLLNGLPALRSLALQQNQISGSLPSLLNLHDLEEVYLDGNQFSSFPPQFLSNLPSLQSLSFSNNPLPPWTLPGPTLSNLTSLQALIVSNASLYGQIPDIFGSLPSLQNLKLSYNNLSGPLPPSFAGSSIQRLWINDQKSGLSGTLQVLDEMPSLAQVWVHDNDFVGPIPDLSKATQLFDLQLRGNQLTGLVPNSLMNLPKLANVTLQKNMLQGPVPVFKKGVQSSVLPNSFCNPSPGPCDQQVMVLLEIAGAFGYPVSLAQSWKGNNACDGWSHVTCDSSGKTVTGINLAKQGLVGTISPIFSNLTSLNTLVLSDNNLFGLIPNTLTSLGKLQRLDVSNNNLTGKVPSFSRSVVVNADGNPFIGTNVDTTPPPLFNPVGGKGSSGSSSKSPSSSSSSSAGLLIGIVIAVIVVLAILIWLLCVRNGKMKVIVHGWLRKMMGRKRQGKTIYNVNPSTSISTIHPFDGSNVVYSIGVLQKATNNFSDNNILGKGGFGIVYKGGLEDGTQIAVKRMELNPLGTKGSSEFEAEIAVLSKVRHRHLVALLGYCANGNEKLLVYEYMPQGTLSQHLLEWKSLGLNPLTWKQRLVIALDVARGVEYLHSLAQQSFIHRDLKPSNVLLGNDMRAKVSDFGLVKNAPDGKCSVETRLAGTFGYLAPEYASTGRVTTKVDVFAFGVVLMELITARKALDEALPEEEVQLVSWFRRVLLDKGQLNKAIDPSLNPDDEMYASIGKVAELAGHCTTREPLQRPEMGHAVNVLSPLVEQWRPTKSNSGDDSFAIDVEMSLPQAMRKWQSGETSVVSDYNNSMTTSTAPTAPEGNTFREEFGSR